MVNERHSNSEPERNEPQSDPNIHGRIEALKEKASQLSDTLGKIEKALEEEP